MCTAWNCLKALVCLVAAGLSTTKLLALCVANPLLHLVRLLGRSYDFEAMSNRQSVLGCYQMIGLKYPNDLQCEMHDWTGAEQMNCLCNLQASC